MSVSVSFNDKGALERELIITIPEADIESLIEKRLAEIRTKVPMKGFRRQQKQSAYVRAKQRDRIRNMYEGAILQEIIPDTIEKNLREQLDARELQPAVMPKIDVDYPGVGHDLRFTASFEVIPQFDRIDLAALKLNLLKAGEVAESDVDEAIEDLRSQNRVWLPVDREARQGDRVTVDFKGMIDGEAFAGGAAQDQHIELGKSQYIEGFEAGIEGHRAGESFEVSVTFPSDYGQENLAGKPAVFEMTLHEVSEAQLPSLDEAFVKHLGIESGEMAELRKQVSSMLLGNLRSYVEQKNEEVIQKALMAGHHFPLPLSAIREQLKERMSQDQHEHEHEHDHDCDHDHGHDHDHDHDGECHHHDAEQTLPDLEGDDPKVVQVREDLQWAYIRDAWFKVANIQLDNNRVLSRVREMADYFQDQAFFMNHYVKNKEFLNRVRQSVFESQLIEYIEGQAETAYDEISYADWMKKDKEQD